MGLFLQDPPKVKGALTSAPAAKAHNRGLPLGRNQLGGCAFSADSGKLGLSSAQAGELAPLLIEGADEIDRWTGERNI